MLVVLIAIWQVLSGVPLTAGTTYTLVSPWSDDVDKPVLAAAAGGPVRMELKPFEVVLFDAIPQDSRADDGFEKLFREEGVPKGWVVRRWNDLKLPADPGVEWKVIDGVLHGSEPRGTWLISEQEYADFVLKFEFKLGPRGNSGCALRAPMFGDPAFDGLELQMADYRYNTEAKIRETLEQAESHGITGFNTWVMDDNSALFLSKDETPTNITQIASVPGWTSSRQWEKYREPPSKPGSWRAKRAARKAGCFQASGRDSPAGRCPNP